MSSKFQRIVNNPYFEAFFIVITLIMIYYYASTINNWVFYAYFGLLILVPIAYYVLMAILKNKTEILPINYPQIIFSISIMFWLLLLNIIILLFIILFISLLYFFDKNQVENKRYNRIALFSFSLIILYLAVNSNPIIPAFISESNNQSLNLSREANLSHEDFSENAYDGFNPSLPLYRNLAFFYIETDSISDELVFNSRLINLSIYVNVSDYIPNTQTEFWDCLIKAHIWYFDDYFEDSLYKDGYTSYQLLDELLDKTRNSQFSYYGSNESLKEVSLDLDYIKMGKYLLILDFILIPSDKNEPLYEIYSMSEIPCQFGYNISDVMNFEYIPDRQGFVYRSYSLALQREVSYMDYLVDVKTRNLMILFFTLFFFATLLSLITRSLSYMKFMILILIGLFMVGLFTILAEAMENTPTWLRELLDNPLYADYIWATIEVVKYTIVMGTTMVIIYLISMKLDVLMSKVSFNRDGQKKKNKMAKQFYITKTKIQ